MLRGEWTDPRLGRVAFVDYGERWIAERRLRLGPGRSTPASGGTTSSRSWDTSSSGTSVRRRSGAGAPRSWRTDARRTGRPRRTASCAPILNTAVDDGRIKRNPCRIKGAGEHRTAERPTATVAQVYALAERMPRRFRALVLAAAFTGLRWGELIALRRCDVDTSTRVLHVRRRLAQLESRRHAGRARPSPPQEFGTSALPGFLAEELAAHITEPSPETAPRASSSAARRAPCCAEATSVGQ